MMQFQNMIKDKGIQYSSIFNLELKDTIMSTETTIPDTPTTLFHTIKTSREWNQTEQQELIDFLEEQYLDRMWSYTTAAGVFYMGSPRFVACI
jgi:hypothetical protein